MRFDALSQFFEQQPPGILAHRLADLRFRQWLAAAPTPYLEQALGPAAPRWVYFYDRDSIEHDHAHRESVHGVDVERARRLSHGLRGEGIDLSRVLLMRNVGEYAGVARPGRAWPTPRLALLSNAARVDSPGCAGWQQR